MERGDLICDWRFPPEIMELPPNTLHLWSLSLKHAGAYREALRKLLAPGELAKARRIHLPRVRDGFVARRGALRDILRRYQSQMPPDLEFSYGLYGKPFLPPSPGAPALSFNSSRSGERGLVAVTRTYAVGIDIELIKPCDDYSAVAANFFSPPEFRALTALLSAPQLHFFMRCWTRKEALSKAIGSGFHLEWTSFDVSPSPPRRVQVAGHGSSKWSVYSFIAAPGYTGALAIDGVNPNFKFWTWPGPADLRFSPRVEALDTPLSETSIHHLSNEVAG